MARPWSRKHGGDPSHSSKHAKPAEEREKSVRLDAEDNAWWSQTEVERVWTPKVRGRPDEEPPRDILAEHFGDDWRTNFLSPPTEEELAAERSDEQDPYRVLHVDPTATWDEIVAAHRHQARVHHPDRLFGQSAEEKADGEDRIRIINAAYQELRVRRGM